MHDMTQKKDKPWIYEQIQAARVRKPIGNAIVEMVDVFEKVSEGMSDTDMKKVLEIFSKVALGQPIIKENKNEVWMPLQPGAITVGDIVRVKFDAYTGDLGRVHNGRRGRVVAVRYGDVIFKSDDGKTPVLDGTHYSPYSLEKLVSGQ